MSNPPTEAHIVRVAHDAQQGTFGVLVLREKAFCVTLERPWMDNQRDISCIPLGDYSCQHVQSQRFGDAFVVRDVPGRTHILFHIGNTVEDTSGCILLGQRFDDGKGQMIHDSKKAFDAFMAALDGRETFKLTIQER